MSRAVYASLLAPEFDDFLFAPVSAERNGMRLSVVSALARLELDPWQEAATLAGLPEPTATARLASLIALLPNESATQPDPDAIAAGLVALLPSRAGSRAVPQRTLLGAGKVAHPWTVICLVLVILALGTEWIVTSHQFSGRTDQLHASTSGTFLSWSAPITDR